MKNNVMLSEQDKKDMISNRLARITEECFDAVNANNIPITPDKIEEAMIVALMRVSEDYEEYKTLKRPDVIPPDLIVCLNMAFKIVCDHVDMMKQPKGRLIH